MKLRFSLIGALLVLGLAAMAPLPAAGAIRDLPGFAANAYGQNDDGTFPCTGLNSGVPTNSCTPVAVPIGFSVTFYGETFSELYRRNIAGTITSLDAAGATMVVKDLATKKQVTIHITAETQMRRLPEMMARMLAMRLKGTTSGAQGGWGGNASAANGAAGGQRGVGGGQGAGGGQWSGRGAPDPQQMLSRAPAIQLSDLQKGEAVMLVGTPRCRGFLPRLRSKGCI